MATGNSIFITIFRLLSLSRVNLLTILWFFTFVSGATATYPLTQEEPNLGDCPKCHIKIVNQNDRDGKAHKNKVTCLDCHVGHPPKKWGIIPRCSKCHKDQAHFKLKNCLNCHTNPHTPLRITLPKHATEQCLTCHHEQIKQLKQYPSIHSTLYCTSCHTKHGYKPTCFQCHAGHLSFMTMTDCRRCHKPHMPLHVTYGDDIPSEYCGACHQDEYKLLSNSHAKHRKLLCVTCHSAVHKTIPQCNKCHKNQHGESFVKRFGSCLTCHKNPHNLQLDQIDIQLEIESKERQIK